jgi:hypothetical protein
MLWRGGPVTRRPTPSLASNFHVLETPRRPPALSSNKSPALVMTHSPARHSGLPQMSTCERKPLNLNIPQRAEQSSQIRNVEAYNSFVINRRVAGGCRPRNISRVMPTESRRVTPGSVQD